MNNQKFISSNLLNTAVLFLVFNRPDLTKQVFQEIRKIKPPRLYVAADGPRAEKIGELEKVEQVRKIATQVDWECEVKTLFREKNLGGGRAVSSAITWFFENEEMGIILEDDCLPSQSFFWFCEELLERYKNDMRIMLVSGYNKQETWSSNQYDYFFSHFGGIWGWASWKRAWQHYDFEMRQLEEFTKFKNFKHLLGNKLGLIREKQMKNVFLKDIDFWDYQWGFARHINSGLACVPSKNLVENIGFGEDATHTQYGSCDIKKYEITFPLKENRFVVADRKYDQLFHPSVSIFGRIAKKIKRMFYEKSINF